MDTFPNIEPTRASSKAVKTRTLVANFGDGYTSRAGDGIHTIKEEWSVQWAGLDATSANTIISFLEAKEGYEAFAWTGFRESSPKKYICKEWNESYHGNSLTSISATFEQVFDEGAI